MHSALCQRAVYACACMSDLNQNCFNITHIMQLKDLEWINDVFHYLLFSYYHLFNEWDYLSLKIVKQEHLESKEVECP